MALLPPYSDKPGENASEKKSENQTRPLGSNGIDTLNTSTSTGTAERANRFASQSPETQGTTSSDTALSRLAQRASSSSGYAMPRATSPVGTSSGRVGARSSSLDNSDEARTRFSSSPSMSSGMTAGASSRASTGTSAGSGLSSSSLGGSRPTASSGLSGQGRTASDSRFSSGSSRLAGGDARTPASTGSTSSLGAGASRGSALGAAAPRTGSFASQRSDAASTRPTYERSSASGVTGTGGTAGATRTLGTGGIASGTRTSGLSGASSAGRLTGSGLASGSLGSSLSGRMGSPATNADSSLASSSSARPSLGAGRSSGLAVSRDAGGISDEEFAQLQEFIYTQSGIFIADTRKYLVENRLSNRLRELNLKSFNEYYYYLRFDKNKTEELQKLFNVITTNETSFYRNPPQLKVFQEVVVPQELEKIRASGQRKLRIWSAGCSTGEEPYTLAIILKEVLGSQLSQWDIKITANDLSEDVLRAAQRGIYSEYALRTTPPEIVERHFKKEGATFHIDPTLKRMVSFGSINLSNKTMLKRVERSHIVFCRNVIIYFDEEMKRQVIESFYDNLFPGACMLIGHSESLHNLSRAFTPEHYPGTIVYRKQE